MLARKSQATFLSISQNTYRQMASKSASVRRRPIHWKAAAPESLPGTLTFAGQRALPQLPVPKLEDTVVRLKESLKPIAWSEDEYNAVAKKIDTFAATKGPELHERLLGRAAERPHWLEEWWDDAGYLGYRDSVCGITLVPSYRTELS